MTDDFQRVLDELMEIYVAKDSDYSGGVPYGNFMEVKKIGLPPHVGAFVRLMDKYARAAALISGKDPQIIDEKLEDTLLDLANYAILTLILFRKYADS